ncbi:MAG: universal stress protein [Cyanobacteriota bacterium ELA615]
MFKTVLFPVDSSKDSLEAAQVVAELVKSCHSRLYLLSVVEIETAGKHRESTMQSPEEVAMLLQGVKAFFAERGVETELLERQGIPSFMICDVADEIAADLIVMGCRGLGLTSEGLAESVTYRVVNLSPCPVLVVP